MSSVRLAETVRGLRELSQLLEAGASRLAEGNAWLLPRSVLHFRQMRQSNLTLLNSIIEKGLRAAAGQVQAMLMGCI